MYNFLVKNGQQAAFGIGFLITVIFFVMALNGGEDPDRFNFGLGIAIVLAVLCAIAMLLFGLYQIVTNPKGSMKGLITFGLLIGLFAVMYATSDAGRDVIGATLDEFKVGDGASKMISAAIMTTFILMMITLATLVLSEVRNFFK